MSVQTLGSRAKPATAEELLATFCEELFVEFDGIRALFVLTHSGLVVHKHLPEHEIEPPAIALIAGVGSFEALGRHLDMGGFRRSLLECQRGILLHAEIHERWILAALLTRELRIGSVWSHLGVAIPEFQSRLQALEHSGEGEHSDEGERSGEGEHTGEGERQKGETRR